MPGREGDVVTQRQQLVLDGVDQVGVVALREIGAANAAGEQHIAHEGVARGGLEQDDVTRRVAGAVQHLQGAVTDLNRVAIGEPARGAELLGWWKAEHLRLLGQGVDPELITRVRAFDGQRVLARQGAGGACVVDVRVGEPQGLEVQAQGLDGGHEGGDVAAGVDQGGVVGFIAPDKAGVLGESGDWDG